MSPPGQRKKNLWKENGNGHATDFTAEFQDVGPGSPNLGVHSYNGLDMSDPTASWISATGNPRILESVDEEDDSSNSQLRPVLQRVPSGDSFHTCISHESVLQRSINGTQSHNRERSDEELSTTSTAFRSGLTSLREPCLAARQIAPTASQSMQPRPYSGGYETGSTSIGKRPSLTSHQDGGTQSVVSAFMGTGSQSMNKPLQSEELGRSQRLGQRIKRISHLRRSMRGKPGETKPAETESIPIKTVRRISLNGHSNGCKEAKDSPPKKRGNPNMPHDYAWVTELLEMICSNQAGCVGSVDRNNPAALKATPLFVVCGACPSGWAPMQAVLYSAIGDNGVDFWWTKPRKQAPDLLERLTLDRWSKGPYKNDPGRSKGIYKPLADLFTADKCGKEDQQFKFGLEPANGSCRRAFIEDPRKQPPGRYYLYFVWQEEWTQNPLASNKFIKGKIAYQREPERGLSAVMFLREYCITNGKLELSEVEELASEVLPGATLKELGTLKASAT